MKNYILFDNHIREHLMPFTFIRPIAEIRIGMSTICDKWGNSLNAEVFSLAPEYLRKFYDCYECKDNFFIAGNLLPNPKLVRAIRSLQTGEALVDPQQNLMVFRAGSIEKFERLEILEKKEFTEQFLSIQSKQDIFTYNYLELNREFIQFTKGEKSEILGCSNCLIGNLKDIFIEEGARVEGAFINCETGPVYIGKNVEIMEGSCIRGPVAIMEGALVKMGTKIYGGTTIGPYCKVGGELNNVVMFGYSNKAHDGFLGNAVIGEWCNIGAGTDASNMKNNYGEVVQWNYATKSYENTGLKFCGLMLGDHSKLGIGTMLNTGTVVGVGCNLYGSEFHRSFVPSFSMGSRAKGYTSNPIEKVLETEQAMFERRKLLLNKDYADILTFLSTQMTRIY